MLTAYAPPVTSTRKISGITVWSYCTSVNAGSIAVVVDTYESLTV
jgi:hypothetical protein